MRGGRRSMLGFAVPALVPVALLALLRTTDSIDLALTGATFHVIVVTAIASCALAVAVVAAQSGRRTAHHGPVWLATGCLAVGITMIAHGLLTPGVLDRPFNMWVVRAPDVAIFCFSATLGLACLPRNAWTSRLAARCPLATLAVPNLFLLTWAALVLLDPARLHGLAPLADEKLIVDVMSVIDVALLLAVALVHWRRWRLGHDVVQYSLVVAPLMVIGAVTALRFGDLYHLSWWNYHGFLLAGFGGAVHAIVVRADRTSDVRIALARTFDDNPMTHIVEGYPDALKALVRAVEVKDAYTHGHSERTAQLAVELGMRIGLDADLLRAVARGAYLHDVGKVAIPDAILNKPGALTDSERVVIQTHARVGYELVLPVAELAEALPVVLHHHERWDGGGYPNGLQGAEIPLVARVVAVADVWDALTSDRAYRAGMSPRAALALILQGRGTHFDPLAVDALVQVTSDWGYTPERSAPGSDQLVEVAVDQCHEVGANRS